MSNDREAFEASVYCADRRKHTDKKYVNHQTQYNWTLWQAAQSHHAAEREALIRKCAEIVAEHETDWDFAYDDILALLDSGSQEDEEVTCTEFEYREFETGGMRGSDF
jgi:hypothetical protein